MPVNSPYYIVLNGPAEVGKSTLISRGLSTRINFYHRYGSVVVDSFAAPLKHLIATALGTKYKDLKKDVMLAVLQGYTPREFLIHIGAEVRCKYGEDIFGRLLEHRILRINPMPDFVIIDDGGFAPEIEVLGHTHRVVRVTRPGHTYKGDSRGYIPEDKTHYMLDNNGTPEDLAAKLDDLCKWCLALLPEERKSKD